MKKCDKEEHDSIQGERKKKKKNRKKRKKKKKIKIKGRKKKKKTKENREKKKSCTIDTLIAIERIECTLKKKKCVQSDIVSE